MNRRPVRRTRLEATGTRPETFATLYFLDDVQRKLERAFHDAEPDGIVVDFGDDDEARARATRLAERRGRAFLITASIHARNLRSVTQTHEQAHFRERALREPISVVMCEVDGRSESVGRAFQVFNVGGVYMVRFFMNDGKCVKRKFTHDVVATVASAIDLTVNGFEDDPDDSSGSVSI